jgi:hypothetical protein
LLDSWHRILARAPLTPGSHPSLSVHSQVHDWILVSLNVSFEAACITVQEVGRMLGERRGTSLIFEKRDTTLPIVGEG